MADETLFLWRMGTLERRPLIRAVTFKTQDVRRRVSVQGIVRKGGNVVPGRKIKKESKHRAGGNNDGYRTLHVRTSENNLEQNIRG